MIADSRLVADAASTSAMLLGIDAGASDLRELGLPYVCIDADRRASGTIDAIPNSRRRRL